MSLGVGITISWCGYGRGIPRVATTAVATFAPKAVLTYIQGFATAANEWEGAAFALLRLAGHEDHERQDTQRAGHVGATS